MTIAGKLAVMVELLALVGCYESHLRNPPVDATAPVDSTISRDAGSDSSPDVCVMVRPALPAPPIEIDFIAKIRDADLALLVDATGSTVQELDRLRESFRETILPELADVIPELRFSVAQFSDVAGGSSPSLFIAHNSTTADPAVVEGSLAHIWRDHGGDGPEGQVFALWFTATGRGHEQGLVHPVAPADCPAGTVGYPCFPPFGGRLVVLFTDAAFHNGPGGAYPYEERFAAPSYEAMLESLRAIGARVVGIYSGAPDAEGQTHLEAVARDTRAIAVLGRPIVRDVGLNGETLPAGTVDAVRTFIEEAPLDVDLVVEDVPGADGRAPGG